MTVTFGDYTSGLTSLLTDDRAIAEVVVIVTLVAILLQREMLRDLPQLWAKAGFRGLTAVAVPLAVAWVAIISQRILDMIVG